MHRFTGAKALFPVLLIHGSIEDARIFYSRSGKGLAYYLAAEGFDVFAPDMVGKGQSEPPISRKLKHSQHDTIHTEIGAYADHVRAIHPHTPLRLGAHSWGGVLLLAWMAHYGSLYALGPAVFFGSKRRISVLSARRLFMVDVMWTAVGSAGAALLGYLPAKALRMGSQNEPAAMYFEVNRWVYSRSWHEPRTGVDVRLALRQMELPPVLFFAGIQDHVLGHPTDVEKLMHEAGGYQHEFVLLAKHTGHLRDYGHIDMLTAPECTQDHFPMALRWLRDGSIARPPAE
jgi:predicted alpha/beta hydrolase